MLHSHAADRLRSVGLRVTNPRRVVLEVLDRARLDGEHLTVPTMAERARVELGAVSTQAVYDCVEAMTRAGLVRHIEPAGHPGRFETRVGDNHHHVVCRGCGRTTDVDCTVGAAPCLTPVDTAGFVVDEAEVTFWGRCPACATNPPPTRPPTTPSEKNRKALP